MLRDSLRIIGVACIISGIALFFTGELSTNSPLVDKKASALQEEVNSLLSTLKETEEELAILQMSTSVVENETTEENPVDGTDKKTEATPIVKMVLRIESGTTSSKVSYDLERTGVISSATEFENYLTSNGLSGKIQIGEYELDSSMSTEAIAAFITSSK